MLTQPYVHPPIHVCSLVHLQHIIFSSTVHVRQFLKSGSPFIEAVVVLVSAAWGVQRGEASCVRATSLIVKHQQRVIGGRCRVIVCCLKVLRGKQDTDSYFLECLFYINSGKMDTGGMKTFPTIIKSTSWGSHGIWFQWICILCQQFI